MKRSLNQSTCIALLVGMTISVQTSTLLAARLQAAPEPPEFRPPQFPAYENDLIFGIFNPNGDGTTEIYRSQNANGDFELIASVPAAEDHFLDRDLKSNTTYYYKLRAEVDSMFSGFSNVLELMTGFKLYPPLLSATAISSSIIEVTLQDVSYNDTSYDLWRDVGATGELIKTISAPDSGEVFIVADTGLLPSTQYTYRVDVHAQGPGNVFYPGMVTAIATTPAADTLMQPSISNQPPSQFYCESTIELNYNNPNEGTQTEIYRSTEENGSYTLITTQSSGVSQYIDEGVHSNIVYYYKIRAIAGNVVSSYSAVWSLRSPSDFYYPGLTAEAVENGVELNLIDNSYADLYYYIRRYETGTDNWIDLPLTISLPDSGSVYTYVDESAEPNTAYRYYIDATLNCDGQPQYTEIVYADVNTAASPAVFDFTLVDPATDMDVAAMYDSMEFSAADRLNIRANTNEATKSVAFFINGTRYWGENEAPYALFGDRRGDYKPGRFKPGEYTVEAVPYSENLHTGVTGESATIHFRVVDEQGSTGSRTFATVNVFPNPVVEDATIEVAGEPNARVSLEITDPAGYPVQKIEAPLDNLGWLTQDWNTGNLRPGVYYMVIKMGEESHTKRILVK